MVFTRSGLFERRVVIITQESESRWALGNEAGRTHNSFSQFGVVETTRSKTPFIEGLFPARDQKTHGFPAVAR